MPEELQKHCDIWVPQLGRFDAQMGMIQQRIASGREVWFYVCLFPNGTLYEPADGLPPASRRACCTGSISATDLPAFCTGAGATGRPTPFSTPSPSSMPMPRCCHPGDAFIVYPDRERKSVYSSIRLETMLEGTEDYEMLMALKANDPAAANRLGQEGRRRTYRLRARPGEVPRHRTRTAGRPEQVESNSA